MTPIVFVIAGLIFACTAATYTEATTRFPEAGGSSSFARRAFNEFWSFFAAWGQMLNYLAQIHGSVESRPIGMFVGHARREARARCRATITQTAFVEGVIAMLQQGQVFELKARGRKGRGSGPTGTGPADETRNACSAAASEARPTPGGAGAGAGAAPARARHRENAHPRRVRRRVPRAARGRAGDDREAALAARQGGRRLRRPSPSASSARRRSPPGG